MNLVQESEKSDFTLKVSFALPCKLPKLLYFSIYPLWHTGCTRALVRMYKINQFREV